jgi:hypothetical protein
MAREEQPCGTYRGYMRHYRRDRKVGCFACIVAMNVYHQDRRLAEQRRATLDAEVGIWERQRREAS